MEKTFSLRDMARLITRNGEAMEIEVTLQTLRGWADPRRLFINGHRKANTSPVNYPLSEVCKAAVLMTLRRSFGSEGELVLEFGEKLLQYRKVNSGPGPSNSDVDVTFGNMLEAVARGEDWRLQHFTIRDPSDAVSVSLVYGPKAILDRDSYGSKFGYEILSVLEIRLRELLAPIVRAARND